MKEEAWSQKHKIMIAEKYKKNIERSTDVVNELKMIVRVIKFRVHKNVSEKQ